MEDEKAVVKRDAHGRILPGYTGNPRGINKGTKQYVSNTILDALSKKTNETGDKTNLEAVVEVLIDEALHKNMKAIEILFDRGFGKAKEFIEVSTPTITIIDSLDADVEEENDSIGGTEIITPESDEGVQE